MLCLSPLMGWGGTELFAKQDPDLAWKKPVGAQLFEEARTAYDAKEYAEAVKKFKDARKAGQKPGDPDAHRQLAAGDGGGE